MTDDQMLEQVFENARATPPMPSNALMARVLEDAARQARMPSWWHVLWHNIGGYAGVSGLIAATVTGVWIGVAPPDGLAASVDAFWVSDDMFGALYGAENWDGGEG